MKEQADIEELIGKYFSGEASPDEAMFLEDWKNSSEANRVLFSQYEKIFFVSNANAEKAWINVRSTVTAPAKVISISPAARYWRAAASVALILGLVSVLGYLLLNKEDEAILYATSAESKQVTLSDGSDVTISPNSSITADAGFGTKERLLHLKGSAYFSVVHDDAKPFVVEAAGVFIKDIGTRFFIRTSSDTDTVHVKVDEGVVLLFDDKGVSVEIKAGGNALYVKSTRQIIENKPGEIKPAAFSFSGNTLAEVVVKLGETYKTRIEIENPALGKCTITARFTDEKLETVLSVIAETLELTYQKTATGYIFKGDKCNQ